MANLHYVPKSHLIHFTNKETHDFFAIDKKYLSRPKSVSPAMVCYYPDYYRITHPEFLRQLNSQDEYFIEKSFEYERSTINSLTEHFESKASFIPMSDCYKLIDTVMSIKFRNDLFRSLITEDQIKKMSEYDIPVRMGQEKIGDEFALDEKHSYILGMYKQKEPLLIGMIESSIASSTFEILIPFEESDYVVTTDNPGYTINKSNELMNADFLNFNEIIFPISSRRLLKITRKQDQPYSLSKTINYRGASTDEIFKINKKLCHFANQKIFCENREYVNFIRLYIKQFKLST